jgi:lipopolysaccharide export system protein LptA
MSRIKLLQIILYLTVTTAPGLSWGLESDSRKPIQIDADSAAMDDGEKRVTYRGNVILTQGTMRLDADMLTIQQEKTGNKGDILFANGRPAKFRQEVEGKPGAFVLGRGNRIEYYSKSALLHLIGNASLTQDGNTIKSDRITYNRNKSLIQGGSAAKGKKRVHFTFKSQTD